MLNKIRIVLINTSHAGNIGAVARAMKNMNLSHLYLVAPKNFPHVDATARAAGADDILAKAIITTDLDTAIADCVLVLGTSARFRELQLPMLEPRACGAKIVDIAKGREVAILFGPENNGLTNDDLLKCHYHIRIPTIPQFSSLNLGAAVQLITYELFVYATSNTELSCVKTDELASATDYALFYQHLIDALTKVGFLTPLNTSHVMLRLRRLFNRTQLEVKEINILRGILTEIMKKID